MLSPWQFQGDKIIVRCWDLTHAHQAFLNIIQYPQGEKEVSVSEDTATACPETALATGTTRNKRTKPCQYQLP